MVLLFLSLIAIAGCRSTPRLVRQSVTTRLAIPVDSSSASDIDWPSTRSSKPTVPSTSVRIGRVYGSHSAMRCPRLILSSSSTSRRAPYWMRCTARSVPSGSSTAMTILRAMAIVCPSEFFTTFLFLILIVPSKFDSMTDCSEICAAPPIWNVRMVSCVPGSPIDCAAMTPTASPILTGVPRARSPVALGAHSAGGLAGEHRADAQFLHPGGLDRFDLRLFEQRALLDDDLVRGGIAHVLGGGAAEDAALERSHHGAGVDDGADLDSRRGAAVLRRDDAVLRHVDQAPGEVAGVRGLERGIGEPLARAVRRVEVLEHREPFLEVADDRALDDLARRLGHQAAHAGELAHLLRRTACAGMRHHVDRVDLSRVAAAVDPLDRRNLAHHFVSDLVGRLRPGVDNLVVLLALGDQAVVVLLLEFLGERAGLLDDLPFGAGNHHVVLAERNAGLEGVVETERHDPVAEDHRLLLPAVAVDLVDHARDFPLGHELVDKLEGDLRALRQHLAEHYAAGRGHEVPTQGLALLVDPFPVILDLRVQPDRFLVQRVLDFLSVPVDGADHVLLLRVALELLLGMQLHLPLARIAFTHDR